MRRLIAGTAGWVFGISLTILFASVWGRAVVVDSQALGTALSPLAQTVILVDQFKDWLSGQLVDSGFDPGLTPVAARRVLADSSIDDVVNELVRQVVVASATVGPKGSSVDVGHILSPVVPEIAVSLQASGIPVSQSQVARVVAGIDPLIIREPGALPVVGPESPAAARLATASVLALLTMMLTAAVVIRSASDRMAAARGLLVRVALSGLAFGLMLRIGSWVLDPGGGRAPVSQALSGLALAKWLVPVGIAGLAGALAGVSWLLRGSVRRTAEIPSPSGGPIRQRG